VDAVGDLSAAFSVQRLKEVALENGATDVRHPWKCHLYHKKEAFKL